MVSIFSRRAIQKPVKYLRWSFWWKSINYSRKKLHLRYLTSSEYASPNKCQKRNTDSYQKQN